MMSMGALPNYGVVGWRGTLEGEKGPPLRMGSHMIVQGEGATREGEADEERAKLWAALWAAGEPDLEATGGLGGGVKRIKRLRAEQVRALEASFAEEAKLEPERKVELAEQLGLQPRQVAIWFQNRRARSKSKQLELDFATLSSHYHSLLAETHRLKAQVAQLTSELEHAKNGTFKDGMLSIKHTSIAVIKDDDSLKGELPSKKDVFTNDKKTTTLSNHVGQSSPSCSDYSVSQNSTSMNHEDVSAYNSNNLDDLEYACLPRDWSMEEILAAQQGLAILAYNNMHSHDLVLEEQPFTNNVHHVGMDWPWELGT
ncbi:hypothetical protein GOP47_0011154 [Adiantum capillus-veneris]|uniref:Homeobox domain-containing protein n=1 Tax=Adiantum capillus-veneris TaxID=13818 RepID=A0A9D4USR3_ADICA|nr:hypothetical protein GOP47_0011154 [Adiantum capillus-veneris]